MKIKKIGKKLALNKKTIAHLYNGELNAIRGGDDETQVGLSCPYCPDTNGYTCVYGRTCVSCYPNPCLETEPISACC